MYEIHGWLVLRESPAEVDLGGLAAVVASVRAEGERMGDGSQTLTVVEPNGMATLVVTALFNHAGDRRVGAVRDLILDVCRTAPGSYGTFSVWDTDDPALGNEMQIVTVRRGQVEVTSDARLSPCVPSIEDPP